MQDSTTRRPGRSLARAGAALAVVAAAAALAGQALAFDPATSASIAPLPGQKAKGNASVTAAGSGTSIGVQLTGLAPKAAVSVLFKSGTCKKQSASFAGVAQGAADAKGAFSGGGPLTFRGGPLGFNSVADGKHVLVVVAAGKQVACGVIPGMS